MKITNGQKNVHDSRESWLRAGTDALRPYFKSLGEVTYRDASEELVRVSLELPMNIRYAIAFPSTGRHGARVGECWHASVSEDENFEIIVRADVADPVEVLGILVHELIHVLMPIGTGHGKLYRAAAIKVGLVGKMVHAAPGQLLRQRLVELAADLGPLPHARLKIERGRENKGSDDRPRKQKSRMLKAECLQCDAELKPYIIRIAGSSARDPGAPNCPKHGVTLTVNWPEGEEEVDSEDVSVELSEEVRQGV